ncbi:MAG: hypothetical protein K6G73_04100 [Marinilabiliaceae bacterium]|jgi:DNA repair exonuclease SbcCD ATPase subunit|nr:hypothetical protein [Marinilabiliaceae bacterium]
MNKSFFSIVIISSLLLILNISCGHQEQIDRLQYQIDSLKQAKSESDSSLSVITSTMLDIEETISSIKEKRGIISITKGDSNKRKIKDDLEALDKRLQDDKQRLSRLQSLLNSSNKKNTELMAMVESLQSQVAQQSAEIAQLNEQLSLQNATIAQQTKQISTLESDLSTSQAQAAQASQLAQETKSQLDATTEEMNRVYFAIGTRSELKNKGIMKGLSKVDISQSNRASFETADKTTFTRVNLGGVFKKILTDQPENSYEIEESEDGDVLVITNKAAFWQRSSYLVVRIK